MSIDKNNIKDRYIATLCMHTLGDIIGFCNGKWEFKISIGKYGKDPTEAIYGAISDFVDYGGISQLPVNEWFASDDTIYHLETAKILINEDINLSDELYIKIRKYYINAMNRINKDKLDNLIDRKPGKQMLRAISKFDNTDERLEPYKEFSGGNGSAMRTHCIGLAFHNDIKKLINFSIESSKMTHNSPISYLGGLASALFTSFAIQNINIEEWGFKFYNILNSEDIKSLFNKNNIVENIYLDYDRFKKKWYDFLELRFDSNRKLIPFKTMSNLIRRYQHYKEHFSNPNTDIIGETGDYATIIAYDCLLDSKDNYEKLIYFTALTYGDSDTLCAIASGWYGAYYGFRNVPNNLYQKFEFRDESFDLAKKLFKKYYD